MGIQKEKGIMHYVKKLLDIGRHRLFLHYLPLCLVIPIVINDSIRTINILAVATAQPIQERWRFWLSSLHVGLLLQPERN